MKLFFAPQRLVFQQQPNPEAQPQPQPQVETGKEAVKPPETGKEALPNSAEGISNEYKEKAKPFVAANADKLTTIENLFQNIGR